MQRISTLLHEHSNLPLVMADAKKKAESQEVQLSISGIVKAKATTITVLK